MVNIRKAAVIGCGFVGAASAFSLLQSGLFSELVLIDANPEKAEGEAMDLNHGVPFARPMRVYAGGYADITDCGIIILTAGGNQPLTGTRLDLVHQNVKIFKSILPQIRGRDCEGILLVVSNPVDILTYAALKLSGFPANRVIGSGTVLDTARLKYLLGCHLHVDSRNVHAFVIGEHGDSELAVWSSANVSGVDLKDYCCMCGAENHKHEMERIYHEVRDSGYTIVEKKGATYYGIAMAVRRICESIVRDEHSILPVSALLSGQYGLDEVCLGVPTIVGRNGVERVLEIPLNIEERGRLAESASMLQEVLGGLEL